MQSINDESAEGFYLQEGDLGDVPEGEGADEEEEDDDKEEPVDDTEEL